MLVLVDEAVSLVKRMLRGIRVNRESLAVDVIERVGIGGHYLQDEHTLKHFRDEIWSPIVTDRRVHASWEKAGAKTMGERCRERVIDILRSHQPEPALEDSMVSELKSFCKKIDET